MAHFARVDNKTKEVIHVHCVDNVNCIDVATKKESEEAGVLYLKKLYKNELWINDVTFIQTSYNSSFRKNYAGKGYYYDEKIQAFIPPKPFPNAILNIDSGKWEMPNSR